MENIRTEIHGGNFLNRTEKCGMSKRLVISIWILHRPLCYLLRYPLKHSGNYVYHLLLRAIPMATLSMAWICGRSLAGITGSNPAGGRGCLSLKSIVCCEVQVSATGRSQVQRSLIECDVETSIMRPTLSKAVQQWKKNYFLTHTNP